MNVPVWLPISTEEFILSNYDMVLDYNSYILTNIYTLIFYIFVFIIVYLSLKLILKVIGKI
jgi:hypothetical protein